MEHAAKNFEPSLNVLITRNIVHKQIRKVRIEETEVLATAVWKVITFCHATTYINGFKIDSEDGYSIGPDNSY